MTCDAQHHEDFTTTSCAATKLAAHDQAWGCAVCCRGMRAAFQCCHRLHLGAKYQLESDCGGTPNTVIGAVQLLPRDKSGGGPSMLITNSPATWTMPDAAFALWSLAFQSANASAHCSEQRTDLHKHQPACQAKAPCLLHSSVPAACCLPAMPSTVRAQVAPTKATHVDGWRGPWVRKALLPSCPPSSSSLDSVLKAQNQHTPSMTTNRIQNTFHHQLAEPASCSLARAIKDLC